MSELNLQTYKGGRGKKPTFKDIDVYTLESTRASFGRVIQAYGKGEVSESMARTLAYLFTNYLGYWKLEKELQIEERLEKMQELYEDMEARLPK